MAERVDQEMMQQGKSRSEVVREVLLRYMEECEWKRLIRYGVRKAREMGIGREDVAGLLEEYRAEAGQQRQA